MVLSSAELDRMADDMYKGRLLSVSTYCGVCGYNLRTLPYVYICPECGNHYNARPLMMQGIFLPNAAEIPVRDLVITLMTAGATTIIGLGAFQSFDIVRLVIGLFFAAMTIIFAVQGIARLRIYIRAVQIVRRIREEEGGE